MTPETTPNTEAATIKASWIEYLRAGTDVTPLPGKPGTFRICTPIIGRFNDFIGFYATANADGYLLEDDGMAWWNMALSKKPETLPAIIRHMNACALTYGVKLNGLDALPEDPELVKGVTVSRQVTADKLGAGIQRMIGMLTEINLC